jgi:hypothetical protein
MTQTTASPGGGRAAGRMRAIRRRAACRGPGAGCTTPAACWTSPPACTAQVARTPASHRQYHYAQVI